MERSNLLMQHSHPYVHHIYIDSAFLALFGNLCLSLPSLYLSVYIYMHMYIFLCLSLTLPPLSLPIRIHVYIYISFSVSLSLSPSLCLSSSIPTIHFLFSAHLSLFLSYYLHLSLSFVYDFISSLLRSTQKRTRSLEEMEREVSEENPGRRRGD